MKLKRNRFKEDSIRKRAEQIPNVDSDASEDYIKRAYRRLILRYHPDRNSKDRDSMRKMQLIA